MKSAVVRVSPATSSSSLSRYVLLVPGAVRLLVVIGLVVAWQVAAGFGDKTFVAQPTAVVWAMWQLGGNHAVMAALGQTLWELVAAFLIASFCGGAIGLLVGRSRLAGIMLYPIVLFLYALPQAPLLPLFVLMFGLGPAAKIAFGVSHGIFPMIVTVAAGVRDVDPALLKFARSTGAGIHKVLWAIVLPSAMASFFTGLRIAMSSVLLGVLLAELFVSQAGIGFFTHRFADAFQPANLFALIAMLAAMAIGLNEVCRLAERRFNRWRT